MEDEPKDWLDIYGDTELLKRLKVGIGEVSEVSGVPQRQLRYWEDKGIVSPVEPGSSVRRYDYPTIKRILVIKELLDDGYTLNAAARKVEERQERLKLAFGELGRSENLSHEQ
jgi:MerR family transcriptional regulator, global nitrogen regulator